MSNLETELKETKEELQRVNEQLLETQEAFLAELRNKEADELVLLRRLYNYMAPELDNLKRG